MRNGFDYDDIFFLRIKFFTRNIAKIFKYKIASFLIVFWIGSVDRGGSFSYFHYSFFNKRGKKRRKNGKPHGINTVSLFSIWFVYSVKNTCRDLKFSQDINSGLFYA